MNTFKVNYIKDLYKKKKEQKGGHRPAFLPPTKTMATKYFDPEKLKNIPEGGVLTGVISDGLMSGDYGYLIEAFATKSFNINNVSRQDRDDNSAVHLILKSKVTEEEKINLIKLVRQYGGYLNAQNNVGKAPIHLVAEKQLGKVFNYLSDRVKIVNYNVRDRYGRTPLHYAVRGTSKLEASAISVLKKAGEEVEFMEAPGVKAGESPEKIDKATRKRIEDEMGRVGDFKIEDLVENNKDIEYLSQAITKTYEQVSDDLGDCQWELLEKELAGKNYEIKTYITETKDIKEKIRPILVSGAMVQSCYQDDDKREELVLKNANALNQGLTLYTTSPTDFNRINLMRFSILSLPIYNEVKQFMTDTGLGGIDKISKNIIDFAKTLKENEGIAKTHFDIDAKRLPISKLAVILSINKFANFKAIFLKNEKFITDTMWENYIIKSMDEKSPFFMGKNRRQILDKRIRFFGTKIGETDITEPLIISAYQREFRNPQNLKIPEDNPYYSVGNSVNVVHRINYIQNTGKVTSAMILSDLVKDRARTAYGNLFRYSYMYFDGQRYQNPFEFDEFDKANDSFKKYKYTSIDLKRNKDDTKTHFISIKKIEDENKISYQFIPYNLYRGVKRNFEIVYQYLFGEVEKKEDADKLGVMADDYWKTIYAKIEKELGLTKPVREFCKHISELRLENIYHTDYFNNGLDKNGKVQNDYDKKVKALVFVLSMLNFLKTEEGKNINYKMESDRRLGAYFCRSIFRIYKPAGIDEDKVNKILEIFLDNSSTNSFYKMLTPKNDAGLVNVKHQQYAHYLYRMNWLDTKDTTPNPESYKLKEIDRKNPGTIESAYYLALNCAIYAHSLTIENKYEKKYLDSEIKAVKVMIYLAYLYHQWVDVDKKMDTKKDLSAGKYLNFYQENDLKDLYKTDDDGNTNKTTENDQYFHSTFGIKHRKIIHEFFTTKFDTKDPVKNETKRHVILSIHFCILNYLSSFTENYKGSGSVETTKTDYRDKFRIQLKRFSTEADEGLIKDDAFDSTKPYENEGKLTIFADANINTHLGTLGKTDKPNHFQKLVKPDNKNYFEENIYFRLVNEAITAITKKKKLPSYTYFGNTDESADHTNNIFKENTEKTNVLIKIIKTYLDDEDIPNEILAIQKGIIHAEEQKITIEHQYDPNIEIQKLKEEKESKYELEDSPKPDKLEEKPMLIQLQPYQRPDDETKILKIKKDFVIKLIKRTGYADQQDFLGKTPIFYCIDYLGYHFIKEMIKNNGADIFIIKDNQGRTAFEHFLNLYRNFINYKDLETREKKDDAYYNYFIAKPLDKIKEKGAKDKIKESYQAMIDTLNTYIDHDGTTAGDKKDHKKLLDSQMDKIKDLNYKDRKNIESDYVAWKDKYFKMIKTNKEDDYKTLGTTWPPKFNYFIKRLSKQYWVTGENIEEKEHKKLFELAVSPDKYTAIELTNELAKLLRNEINTYCYTYAKFKFKTKENFDTEFDKSKNSVFKTIKKYLDKSIRKWVYQNPKLEFKDEQDDLKNTIKIVFSKIDLSLDDDHEIIRSVDRLDDRFTELLQLYFEGVADILYSFVTNLKTEYRFIRIMDLFIRHDPEKLSSP